MNKNSIITILAVLVGLMTIAFIVKELRQGPTPQPASSSENVAEKAKKDTVTDNTEKTVSNKASDNKAKVTTHTIIDGKTNVVEEVAPTVRSVERRPLEPEATKRLHEGPIVISSVFEASGKGEHASYGKAIRGSYLYTTTVMAQSEVKEKQEDKETGKIRVVERRKFLQARDHLGLSNVDVALALDTLPVNEVKNWACGTCKLVSGVCLAIAPMIPPAAPWLGITSGGVKGAELLINEAFGQLHTIDGVSARGVLGAFGVKIPENIEKFVNEWISKLIEKKFGHFALQSIEGKSFLITYTQDANGKPLNVDYTNEDGSPITDAEWEILRSANVFLDSNAVPDTRCRVGDAWTIWADEVQELFGVAGDGRAEGKIRVERLADQPDGDWTLRLEPAEVQFRTNDGTAAGKMNIKDGNGLVDAKNVAVKSLHATATGSLRSLNKKRHFLFFDFVKRIDGNSNLRFTLTADPSTVSSAK